VATHLREELCEDQREEAPIADDPPDSGYEVVVDDVEFDKDELAYLPDDSEAEEAASKQRALMASFETKHRVDSTRHFMITETRATIARVATAHAGAFQLGHHQNVAAAREVMAASERC
jgi:hypothetical protein